MFILHYVQSGTYLNHHHLIKIILIKINEDHKSQFSLFVVCILTLKYKEYIPKRAKSVLKLGTYIFYWKKSNQK
jgi:hypothetical protein